MPEERYDGLQVDEDLAWQERAWVVQRVAWGAFAVVLLAAAAGFCGTGPASSATAGDSRFQVSYHRFLRYQAPATVEVEVPVEGGEVTVWVDGSYLREMELQHVVPEPDSVEAGEARHSFTFMPAPDASRIVVAFSFRPGRFGRIEGRLGADDRAVTITHLIYP